MMIQMFGVDIGDNATVGFSLEKDHRFHLLLPPSIRFCPIWHYYPIR